MHLNTYSSQLQVQGPPSYDDRINILFFFCMLKTNVL